MNKKKKKGETGWQHTGSVATSISKKGGKKKRRNRAAQCTAQDALSQANFTCYEDDT